MAVGTIPGFMSHSKSEVDGKIQNISSKTMPELLDLRDRQLKLLNNKAFIRKLPDKGVKIQALYDKITLEIKAKEEEDQTCNLFSAMKLHSAIDKDSVQSVEWEGKIPNNKNTYLDSDDDSEPEDVMHILSQNVAKEKQIKVIQQEKPLVTAEDLIEIGEVPYVKKIVEKTDIHTKPKLIGNFKPYKLASDEHNPEKEIQRTRKKHWELTAATPPPFIHGPAKILNLEESLKLQTEYNKHLKVIEAKHAAERLVSMAGVKMPELPLDTSKFGDYRTVDSDDVKSDESDPEGSDKEVHDDEPDRGGVVFTVMK